MREPIVSYVNRLPPTIGEPIRVTSTDDSGLAQVGEVVTVTAVDRVGGDVFVVVAGDGHPPRRFKFETR